MLYDKFKAKNADANILSKIDILGSFDFTTCLISLDSINSKDLKVLSDKRYKDPKINLKYRKILPLAVHEYTHFIDSTSTIWGFNHLIMMNNAYLSNDRLNKDEKLFFQAKKFHNHIARIKYPKYYTTVGKVDTKQWAAYPTIGMLFDNDGQVTDESVMFFRFTSLSKEEIARSPISAVSILEASAMANEVLTEIGLLNQLSKEDFAIEQVFYLKKIMSLIYNKELTEYSACVHMLANQQQCKDIVQAFLLVSLITRVVLNCTEDVFDKIIQNDQLTNTFEFSKEEPFFKSLHNGLKHRNIGVLYYIIVSGLPEESYLSQETAIQGIQESINKLGIDIDFIKSTSNHYVEKNIEKLISSSISSIAEIADSAKSNFDIIDIMSPILELDRLNIPKVFLGDTTETLIFKNQDNKMAEFDLDICFNELSEGESWVHRFSEGCV